MLIDQPGKQAAFRREHSCVELQSQKDECEHAPRKKKVILKDTLNASIPNRVYLIIDLLWISLVDIQRDTYHVHIRHLTRAHHVFPYWLLEMW